MNASEGKLSGGAERVVGSDNDCEGRRSGMGRRQRERERERERDVNISSQ